MCVLSVSQNIQRKNHPPREAEKILSNVHDASSKSPFCLHVDFRSFRGTKTPFNPLRYLLQRAMKEEVIDPITNALMDEIQNPRPDKSKVLLLDDLKNHRKF